MLELLKAADSQLPGIYLGTSDGVFDAGSSVLG
jgi:hypothetical protein